MGGCELDCLLSTGSWPVKGLRQLHAVTTTQPCLSFTSAVTDVLHLSHRTLGPSQASGLEQGLGVSRCHLDADTLHSTSETGFGLAQGASRPHRQPQGALVHGLLDEGQVNLRLAGTSPGRAQPGC